MVLLNVINHIANNVFSGHNCFTYYTLLKKEFLLQTKIKKVARTHQLNKRCFARLGAYFIIIHDTFLRANKRVIFVSVKISIINKTFAKITVFAFNLSVTPLGSTLVNY